MTLTKITDHAQRILDDLLEQFKDKPNLEAILTAIGRQAQDLEDAFWQLLLDRFLPNAVGAQLDIIGRIVRRDRADLSDDVYRAILRGKIAANLSSGTHPEVLRVVELCLDSDNTGAIIEVVLEYPAAVTIRVTEDALVVGLGPHVADLAQLAAGSGVRVLFTYFENDPPFAFDDAAIGFDDATVAWGTTAEGA